MGYAMLARPQGHHAEQRHPLRAPVVTSGEAWGTVAAALVPVLVLVRLELLERRAERHRRVILAAARAAERTASIAAERRHTPR